MPFSYADENNYEEYVERLSIISVFKGTEKGFELDRAPTRLEGLVMLIRLLGQEADANNLMKDPCNFKDVPSWGIGYVNYAFNNGLTNGLGNGLFGSNNAIDANSYITFLLRALGYSDSSTNPDFKWEEAKEFAKEIELLESDLFEEISASDFTRAYVAKLSYDTLTHNLKGSHITLIQKLVADGAISETLAKEMGILPIATLEPYGFTEAFDASIEPQGTVDYFNTTDTIYYVVYGNGFPTGSKIHQAWTKLDEGIIAEGDLNITVDIEEQYIGFWLVPNKKLPAGDYNVTLTWTVDGREGKLISDVIEVR